MVHRYFFSWLAGGLIKASYGYYLKKIKQKIRCKPGGMTLALNYLKAGVGLPEKLQVFAFTSQQHTRFYKLERLIINKLIFEKV
jgi:hypothetical protein